MTRVPFVLILLVLFALSGCETSSMARDREARQRWFDSLTTEQQLRHDIASMQALGLALSGGGPFRPTHQIPWATYQTVPVLPLYQPTQRLPMHCLTQEIGTMATTNCY